MRVNKPNVTHSLTYVPELDGLRAVAVILVLFFHSGWRINDFRVGQGGFVGVDIFFVLSGFLITRILLNQHENQGQINFRQFYVNRLLRLYPALVVMIVSFLLAVILFLPPTAIMNSLVESGYSLTYTSNWIKAYHVHLMPYLGHTWSLAIEEQYYLLWPLLFTVLLQRVTATRSRLLIMGLGIGMVFGYKLLLLNKGVSPARLYNGYDTRLDSLLFGSLLGLAFGHIAPFVSGLCQRHEHVYNFFQLGFLAFVVWVSFGIFETTGYLLSPVYYLVLFTSGALIVSVCSNSHAPGLISVLLSNRFMVNIGILSYGIYLWHLPVYRLMGQSDYFNRFQILTVGTIISFIGAALSYYCIERYFLQLKRKP